MIELEIYEKKKKKMILYLFDIVVALKAFNKPA